MKKYLTFALTLTMVLTISLLAFGQAKKRETVPVKPFKTYTLPCQITKGGDVQSKVNVTNTTGAMIPANEKIYVKIAGASLPNLLSQSFGAGATLPFAGPADHSGSCTAQYTKVGN